MSAKKACWSGVGRADGLCLGPSDLSSCHNPASAPQLSHRGGSPKRGLHPRGEDRGAQPPASATRAPPQAFPGWALTRSCSRRDTVFSRRSVTVSRTLLSSRLRLEKTGCGSARDTWRSGDPGPGGVFPTTERARVGPAVPPAPRESRRELRDLVHLLIHPVCAEHQLYAPSTQLGPEDRNGPGTDSL